MLRTLAPHCSEAVAPQTTAATRKPMIDAYWQRCDPDYADGPDAEGIHLSFEDSNWILYDFDWSNEE